MDLVLARAPVWAAAEPRLELVVWYSVESAEVFGLSVVGPPVAFVTTRPVARVRSFALATNSERHSWLLAPWELAELSWFPKSPAH